MKLKLLMLGAGAALFCTGLAAAHTSYLKPNTFDASRARMVTLESSFTEDFSNPEIAVSSQDWHYVAPDGTRHDYDNVVELKQVTVLESALSLEGTYKFTTGERLGRAGKYIEAADGSYRIARGEDGEEPELAEGERFVTSQTATVADVYISKGAPTATVLETSTGRLALTPITHPNEIYLGEGFSLTVTFDGEPLAGQELELVREGGAYADDKGVSMVTTDAAGVLDLSFNQPGVYLLMTRHQAPAPEGAETEIRSYTTSLTFEVTR